MLLLGLFFLLCSLPIEERTHINTAQTMLPIIDRLLPNVAHANKPPNVYEKQANTNKTYTSSRSRIKNIPI